MKTKFGKVFVVEREISIDGTETLKPKLLEAVLFSNTDYKFYDSEGKLSPVYKKYEGRSFSIQYNLKQQDKDGREVEFKAKLNLPYKLGQLADQDIEGVPAANEKMTKRWEKQNMLSGDEKSDQMYRVMKDCSSANFVAMLSPGWKLSQMKVMLTSSDPYLTLDYYTDAGASQKTMPFKLAKQYYGLLDDILQGKAVNSNLKELPDSLNKIIGGVKALRDDIYASSQPKKYVLQSYRDFHEAFLLENCKEWKQKEASMMFLPINQELRLISIAATVTIEMILYDQGVEVDEKIRESFLFKSLLRAHAKSCSLVNDLVSLKKEMAAGETNNMAYTFHVKDGLSLEDALQKVVDEINLVTKIIIETGDLLISLYGEYEETQKVVDVVKNTIAGNMQWSGVCPRYHDNLITDCIIEL